MKFFTPTAELKELTILQYIEDNEDTTQKELAEVVGAAPSMINVYINDYEEKGYIIREYISAKVLKYKITQEGLRRKNLLLIQYWFIASTTHFASSVVLSTHDTIFLEYRSIIHVRFTNPS